MGDIFGKVAYTKINKISKAQTIKGQIIEQKNSAIINVIGDSTGNATNEWVYLLAQKIATKYPTHNIKYSLFDTATNRYADWTAVQTYGADRYIQQSSNNKPYWMPSADIPLTDSSGDIDLTIKCSLDDWQQTGNPFLLAKWVGGSACFGVRKVGNKIGITYSTNGVNSIVEDTAIDTTAWIDGDIKWIRVTMDVDNGAGGHTLTGYTSSDGVTWTGTTPLVTAGTIAINVNNATNWGVGAAYGNSGWALGKYYEVYVRDGIDGAIVSPQPIDSWLAPTSASGATIGGTPTIYVYNGSVSGYSITDFDTDPKLTHAVPPSFGSLFFISLGHNETSKRSAAYLSELDSVLTKIRAKVISPNVVVLTQNKTTAIYTDARSDRRRMLMNWAEKNGLNWVDVYMAFAQDSRPLADLLDPDGLHLNSAGSELWASTVFNDLNI